MYRPEVEPVIGATTGEQAPEQHIPDPRVLTLQDPEASQREVDMAFGGIYEEYSGPLKGFIQRMVKSPDTAEEIVQEALLNTWRGIDTFDAHDENSSLSAWIYRIARNKALNSTRGPKNRTGKGDVSYEDDYVSYANVYGSSSEDPLVRLVDREELIVVESLSDVDKETLSWDTDSFTYEELAQQNDISVSAVKSRLVRAREARKKAIAELELTEAEKAEIKEEKVKRREERRKATIEARKQEREEADDEELALAA